MSAWPPPPHDPRERVPLIEVEGWEVRCFARSDPKRDYFISRGFWHLQLWYAARGVSVLTPSRLTAGRWELYPYRGWKATASDEEGVVRLLRGEHHVTLPGVPWLRALERWFVTGEVRSETPGPGAGVAQNSV